MNLVDTDVLIWNLRGNERAAERLDQAQDLGISAVTYMELVQGLRNNAEFRQLRQAMRFWDATFIHIDTAISARASMLMEQHALADSLQLGDALIAATALETGRTLLTGNVKHYRRLPALELERFRP